MIDVDLEKVCLSKNGLLAFLSSASVNDDHKSDDEKEWAANQNKSKNNSNDPE